jgi:hypothetical protein
MLSIETKEMQIVVMILNQCFLSLELHLKIYTNIVVQFIYM